ncbi:hypothetical protein BDK51DRAFT_52059 [Blyttiomyces helicus]|uniref:Uncharacterized protein n=1 Tax=Blyttiomyces helicus TaxID=388810 RepID=A0A4P9WEG8_9FUNG|nr:hypothetical protein BDK51DRAFT_52059 [Blyttiomyces helicus]|eukprot:RKO90175.1 hypothetical protein BDK51DRAFT_52059 [Blyttiomyces helicus]
MATLFIILQRLRGQGRTTTLSGEIPDVMMSAVSTSTVRRPLLQSRAVSHLPSRPDSPLLTPAGTASWDPRSIHPHPPKPPVEARASCSLSSYNSQNMPLKGGGEENGQTEPNARNANSVGVVRHR